MGQLNFHTTKASNPPPESYKLWHGFLTHLPRLTRYTLGAKIDNVFTDCLELALLAGYAPRQDKLLLTQRLSTKVDSLKFFLKLLWELKALDTNKYALLSSPVAEIGKMVGGWLNLLKKQTPPLGNGGEKLL